MKMSENSVLVLFILLMFSAPLFAESACIECRKAALAKVALCKDKAKTSAEDSKCNKLANELTVACTNGPCKGVGLVNEKTNPQVALETSNCNEEVES